MTCTTKTRFGSMLNPFSAYPVPQIFTTQCNKSENFNAMPEGKSQEKKKTKKQNILT